MRPGSFLRRLLQFLWWKAVSSERLSPRIADYGNYFPPSETRKPQVSNPTTS